jgi:hypothetical protein
MPGEQSTYEENLSKGEAEDKAVIDNIINNGTPSETGDDYAGLMVPSGSALVGIADRAGYPVLTVPAGFGAENSSTGGDPITPPALRITCASPSLRPSSPFGFSRASMHATIATPRPGGRGRSPLSKSAA